MTNPIADPLVEVVDSDAVSDLVLIEATQDGTATVTINRPQKKNAFDAATISALTQAFETIQGAEGVRIMFLRGQGGAFCAGGDADWMRAAAELTEAENYEDALALAKMLKALHDIPALTVALVEGPAFGGGAGLVAACDMAVAAEDAKFAFSEVRLGLTPATISPYVVRAVGERNAKVLFATARVFGAADAQAWGLVQEVVPAGSLDAVKAALSDGVRACAPEAIGESKRLVDHVAGRPIDRALMEETARRIAARRATAEGQEGLSAFLEKRKPEWAQ